MGQCLAFLFSTATAWRNKRVSPQIFPTLQTALNCKRGEKGEERQKSIRVIGDNETHSGLDTREGKLLRLELQFKDDPLLELKRKDSSVISTLRRGYSYNEVKVYAFLRFTRMVNISSAGIGISE